MGMVKEVRILFDLGDIRAMRLHCKKTHPTGIRCNGETFWRPANDEPPRQCVKCGQSWADDPRDSVITGFLESVHSLMDNKHGASIVLEFEGEE